MKLFQLLYICCAIAFPVAGYGAELVFNGELAEAVTEDAQQNKNDVGAAMAPVIMSIQRSIREGASSATAENPSETPSGNATINTNASQASGSSQPTRGVASIRPTGRVSGTNLTAQTITCNSGSEHRIWRSGDQWWDGIGAQGGSYRSLSEQASFLCN